MAFPRTLRLGAAVLAATLLPGCRTGTHFSVRSIDTGSELRPRFTVAAYVAEDGNTADVFLTDLTRAELDSTAPINTISGHLARVHMFLRPRAGNTPIEDTATNATVELLVLSGGAIGVYEGAGFLQPGSKPGGARFGGSMDGATVRLVASNARFTDPIGPAELDVSFTAPLDRGAAALMRARLETIIGTLGTQ